MNKSSQTKSIKDFTGIPLTCLKTADLKNTPDAFEGRNIVIGKSQNEEWIDKLAWTISFMVPSLNITIHSFVREMATKRLLDNQM